MFVTRALPLLVVFLTLLCADTAVGVNPGVREGNRGEGTYTLSYGDRRMAFEDWKEKFAHIHGSNWDEGVRFGIFSENVVKIEQHNLLYHTSKSSYFLGLNQFSAMTHEEYKHYNRLGRYSTKRQPSTTRGSSAKGEKLQFDQEIDNAPTKVNWTEKGYVTPVKDQGQCDSCWIFSATGAMEGAYFRVHRELKSFSEQQVLDCCDLKYCGKSCHEGGYPEAAYKYVQSARGIQTEEDYPYLVHTTRDCHVDESKQIGSLTSIIEITPAGSEAALKMACAKYGPISVGIDASLDTFNQYAGGVYNDTMCSSDPGTQDHAVLVTGYASTPDNQDFWIVKNSWGKNWGLHGYVLMARNKVNLCGIANNGTFPIFS